MTNARCQITGVKAGRSYHDLQQPKVLEHNYVIMYASYTSITRQYHQVLTNLNLPGLTSLLSELPKCSSWKAFIKKHLGLTSYLTFLKNAMIAMLANVPSNLTTQPPNGRSPAYLSQ